ncbi:hypothetical protein QJQ45_017172, partial [Haematococcus lacustris]
QEGAWGCGCLQLVEWQVVGEVVAELALAGDWAALDPMEDAAALNTLALASAAGSAARGSDEQAGSLGVSGRGGRAGGAASSSSGRPWWWQQGAALLTWGSVPVPATNITAQTTIVVSRWDKLAQATRRQFAAMQQAGALDRCHRHPRAAATCSIQLLRRLARERCQGQKPVGFANAD